MMLFSCNPRTHRTTVQQRYNNGTTTLSFLCAGATNCSRLCRYCAAVSVRGCFIFWVYTQGLCEKRAEAFVDCRTVHKVLRRAAEGGFPYLKRRCLEFCLTHLAEVSFWHWCALTDVKIGGKKMCLRGFPILRCMSTNIQ